MVLIAATLLGSMGVWGRLIFRYEPDPMLVVTWRALFGTLALAAVLAAVRPALLCIRPRDLPFFLLYGFTGITLNFWTYFSAVKYTTLPSPSRSSTPTPSSSPFSRPCFWASASPGPRSAPSSSPCSDLPWWHKHIPSISCG